LRTLQGRLDCHRFEDMKTMNTRRNFCELCVLYQKPVKAHEMIEAKQDSATAQLMEQILYEVKRVVVGQDRLLERMMVALLAQGHLLVEGVPGLAKTLTVKTLAETIGGQFKRIQFTPDLVPSDLVGTRVYNQASGEFSTSLGPVFANLLLADEINRAPAKVQSALLEVMQERQVTIAGQTHKVPSPFLVMATQNPIETEGTYPLPEAQVDRFMMKVLVDYPSDEEERVIVDRVTGPAVKVREVATTEQLAALQKQCREVYVDPSLVDYAVKIVTCTRTPEKYGLKDMRSQITFGASPRATIGLTEGARALALLRGRSYALPEDMSDLVPDVLRHRVVLSYDALSAGLTPDALISQIMQAIAAPPKPLKHIEADEKLAA
jgi:MoxR-like ATPase